MVTDQEIASCVESLLRQAGPGAAATASVAGVVRELEAKLGLDLSHKASFIRDQIQLLLGPPPPASKDPFAAHAGPQFQPYPPNSLTTAGAVHASPFAHLPQHHDLAFRCSPPNAVAATASHHQHLPHPLVAVPRPEVAVGPVSPAVAKPVVASPKESAPTPAKRKGGPGGLNKVCGVSPELQAIVGEPTMARTQIVKQLWAYIRQNNLQDPNNKRKIICNDALRQVFETDCTDMFKMNKLLAKHILPLESPKDPGPDSKRTKSESSEVVSETKPDTGDHNVVISEALALFFGTTEREMLQSEVLKRIWDYIKENHLEDPVNPMILCDSKLQQLFGCGSFSALGISEMVARHLVNQ